MLCGSSGLGIGHFISYNNFNDTSLRFSCASLHFLMPHSMILPNWVSFIPYIWQCSWKYSCLILDFIAFFLLGTCKWPFFDSRTVLAYSSCMCYGIKAMNFVIVFYVLSLFAEHHLVVNEHVIAVIGAIQLIPGILIT